MTHITPIPHTRTKHKETIKIDKTKPIEKIFKIQSLKREDIDLKKTQRENSGNVSVKEPSPPKNELP